MSVLFRVLLLLAALVSSSRAETPRPDFLIKSDSFPALEASRGISGVGERIAFRAHEEPFLVVASIIFLLAIIHTFLAVPITRHAHRIQHAHDAVDGGETASFKGTVLHFLGEIEAIFGIWAVVLLGVMAAFHGLDAVTGYMTQAVNFTEPMFVVVIMALASTRPVLRFAEGCLRFFARFGKGTPAAWWLSILVIAPVLGSFITEPGAMTIAALLLGRKFYHLKPRPMLAYGTLGLLFVNISLGGMLTNFAAPPVLMVARKWELTTPHMALHYGDKALLAIVLSTAAYYVFFRKDLQAMAARAADHEDVSHGETPVPFFVTVAHLLFMLATVVFAHYPPLFIGGFLFFLAFSKATRHHQTPVVLKGPVLVGFFLAGLVIHGGLQGWWLQPIITSLGRLPLFLGSTLLTSFNDNAAITFLASQVEGLPPALQYAVLAGAVTGGGLTVIANAPNPAGQAILGKFFAEGIAPLKLLAAALPPTLVAAFCFLLLSSI